MFKLIALIVILILIPSLLLYGAVKLAEGIMTEPGQNNHRDIYKSHSELGAKDCDNRGMDYITISNPYVDVYNTYCYTDSPFKIYTFEVNN